MSDRDISDYDNLPNADNNIEDGSRDKADNLSDAENMEQEDTKSNMNFDEEYF
jgi:hypothetical protein